jgi:hypothetical protein
VSNIYVHIHVLVLYYALMNVRCTHSTGKSIRWDAAHRLINTDLNDKCSKLRPLFIRHLEQRRRSSLAVIQDALGPWASRMLCN